jgi:hypothetical protein
VKKLQGMESALRWVFMVLAGLLVSFVIAGCCTTRSVTDGRPVEPGTVDQYGNRAPAGAICASGETCVDPGKGCGLFPYKNVCTNVWNSETNECSCKCQSE